MRDRIPSARNWRNLDLDPWLEKVAIVSTWQPDVEWKDGWSGGEVEEWNGEERSLYVRVFFFLVFFFCCVVCLGEEGAVVV